MTARLRLGVSLAAAFSVGAFATAAAAQTVEPNGLAVPQPLSADLPFQTGPASLALQTLFDFRGEQLDGQLDALTTPAVFSPQCAFTGTLVLRGGGCKVDFGWYNAVAGGPPPPDNQIYVLVPKSDPIFNQEFHPQVGESGLPRFAT